MDECFLPGRELGRPLGHLIFSPIAFKRIMWALGHFIFSPIGFKRIILQEDLSEGFKGHPREGTTGELSVNCARRPRHISCLGLTRLSAYPVLNFPEALRHRVMEF